MNPSGPRLLRAGDSVLLVIDLQQRLLAAMPKASQRDLARHAARLLQAANLLDVPVLHSRQYPRGLGETLPELTAWLPADAACDKTCFSCGGNPALREALAQCGRGQLVIAGVETHICVLASALELAAAGLEVHVIEDACASRHPDHHRNALARLRAEGVVVSNHESALFEWLGDAAHPQFKAVSALLRD